MRAPKRTRPAAVAGAVTLALVAVSLATAAGLWQHERGHAEEVERERAGLVADALRNEISDARITLRASAGFLGEQETATEDEFHRFHDAIPQPAALRRIAWAPAVPRDELRDYEAAIGAGVSGDDRGAPGQRPPAPVAFPVLYSAPDDAAGEAMRHRDIAADLAALGAILSARSTGALRVTPPVGLPPDGAPGVLFVVSARGPLPDGGTTDGIVIGVATLADLEASVGLTVPGVDFSVADGARTVLGDPIDAEARGDGAPLRVGGRDWVVSAPRPHGSGVLPALLAGGFGSLAALLVGALMLQAGRREDRIAREVEARTAELAAQAVTDPVSGLANDRALRRALETGLGAGGRQRADMCVALLDIDGFDGLSDALASGTGEPILAAIADRLSASARPGDTLARVGGDEFAWLMPATDLEHAAQLADRARMAVAAAPFAGVGQLTVSAGVASSAGAAGTPQLMARAGTALYWAKSGGRDRVEAFTADRGGDVGPEERARRIERELSLAAVRALAQTVDARDADTRAHSERVARLAARLARALGWTHADARRLHDAALVHDIGKIGVPDAVLFKPGRLSPEEFEAVKAHATLGAEIVAGILDPDQVGWVRHHHERHDGAGYPDGVAGADVPDGARILAVADSFDVMVAVRTYKEARGVDEALAEVRRCAGGQFDPAVVTALGRLWMAGLLPAADRADGRDEGPGTPKGAPGPAVDG